MANRTRTMIAMPLVALTVLASACGSDTSPGATDRPVVVATSDKAVVASVCAQGAHSVPSRVLLQRLARS